MIRRGLLVIAILVASGIDALSGPPVTVGGTIKTLSSESIAVTLSSGKTTKDDVFIVTADTKITLEGKSAKLGDLVPGMKVTVSYDKDSKQASSVRATRVDAATTADPAPPKLVRLDELNTPGRNIGSWLSPDGLTIYWERTGPGQPFGSAMIWTARRKNANSPFENSKPLLQGRCPTVTSDGLQMFLIRPDADGQQKWWQVATRPSIDQPFGPPRDVPELQPRSATERLAGPSISADGLTLSLYVTGDEPGIYMTTRKPGGPWEPLRPIQLTGSTSLYREMSGPFVTKDGLTLFCTHGGNVGQGRIMMWWRKNTASPFTDSRYVAVPEGTTPNRYLGLARYVEATRELFFTNGPLGQEALWVLKNFRPDRTVNSAPDAKQLVDKSKAATTNAAKTQTPQKKAARKSQPTAPTEFRAVLEQACKQSKLPALAAAVVVEGKVVAADAVGVRKLGAQAPVTADDSFHIGSCAKAMTATVVGQLIDSGKLRWETTLAEAFPEHKETMHPAYRAAAVEQILAHRGGFPRNPPGMTPPDIHNLPGRTLREKRLAFVDRVLRQAPAAQPGTQFEYSNVGYTVIGAIAEQATNHQWENLQQELLFKPLGMQSVHFGDVRPGGQNARPWGHLSIGGQVTPFAPGPNPNDPPAMSPAGSVLHCSMTDLARFAAVHLGARGGEKPLLKAETLKRLHTPLVAADAYAAGWGLEQWEWPSGTILSHAGATPMNYCVMWLVPEQKSAVILATNIGPDRAAKPCSDIAGELMEQFLK